MDFRQVALRRHGIPGAQVSGLDPLSETALNPLVRRQSITSTLCFRRHSRSRNLETAYNESTLPRSHWIVKKSGNPAQPLCFVGFPSSHPVSLCPLPPAARALKRLPSSARRGARITPFGRLSV